MSRAGGGATGGVNPSCIVRSCNNRSPWVTNSRRKIVVDWPWAYTHFSPTYRVPSGTSRANSEVVFPDLFRRKLRDGRSRKDRAERGRHHAKGTRYLGELFGRPC